MRKIATIVGVSKSSVYRIRKGQNMDTNDNLGGGPSKLNVMNKRKIVREITSGKVSNAVEASKNLNEGLNIQMHPETIRMNIKKGWFKVHYEEKETKTFK